MENVIVIVDLETTGLSAVDQILEIGALKVNIKTGEVLDRFQTFSLPDSWAGEDDNSLGINFTWSELEGFEMQICEPKERDNLNKISEYFSEINLNEDDGFYHIPEFITELTGITDDMIVGAPSNEEAVNSFLEFTGALEIWAYNAGFDSKFINKFTKSHRPFKDILSVARRAYPELRSHKLELVAEHLGITQSSAHRAISDCLTAKDVLVKGLLIVPDLPHQNHSFKASEYKAKIDGDFYGKTIVFTGSLTTMSRSVADLPPITLPSDSEKSPFKNHVACLSFCA